MTRECFIQLFTQTEFERWYKRLYEFKPEVYKVPFLYWKEFRDRFSDIPDAVAALREAPPTIMDIQLKESDFFLNRMDIRVETSMVVNCRYCPPFLHRLEFIKLIYVFSGSCVFYYDGKWQTLEEGNICIVAPDVMQTLFSHSDRDVVLNILIRRSTFMKSFYELLEGSSVGSLISAFFWKMLYRRPDGKVLVIHSSPDPMLESFIMALYEEVFLSEPKSSLIQNHLALVIFGLIVQLEGIASVEVKGIQKKYPLIDYLNHMKKNLNTVSLSSLALTFNRSEGYLSRYFKKETGKAFSVLLREMKMNRAAELLLKTDCDVRKIISIIGYQDLSIFYRNFKMYYGISPKIFREKNGSVSIREGGGLLP